MKTVFMQAMIAAQWWAVGDLFHHPEVQRGGLPWFAYIAIIAMAALSTAGHVYTRVLDERERLA